MALKLKKQDKDAAAPVAPARTARPRKKSGSVPIKKGGKARSFVLLIGDEGAILVYMEGSKVTRRLFAPSAQPSSTEAMVALMQSNPNVPISLLIDNLDQQYVRQSFPPVSSLSVNGLVKRRLDRDFQPEDLKGSLPLGRDKTGRREWHYLLISLVKTAPLTEWIDLISELPNEMKGIFLVPVEATIYTQMLSSGMAVADPKPWQLIVTHNKVSGFRQVVIHQGKLVFTRVSQAIDDAIPAVIAGNIEQEIINTIEYLRRLNFQDSAGLDMVVIASADVNEALDLKRFNLGHAQALTPLDVADMLGLEQAALSADRFGDVVMAAAFLRAKKHILRFSTVYAASLAKLYTARKGIKIAGVLVALALLGLSIQNILVVSENESLAKESERNRSALQSQLAELKKTVGGLNDNIAFKSAVVNAHDSFLKAVPTPTEFADTLAAILTPEQRVVSIEWVDNTVVKTTGTATNTAPAPNAASGKPQDAKGRNTIKVQFEFKGVYNDLDELSKAEESFLQNLTAKMPEYTITHDIFPWLKGTEKSLEISFDQKQAAGIKEGDNKLLVTFVGPQTKTPTTPGGAPGMASPMNPNRPMPARPTP